MNKLFIDMDNCITDSKILDYINEFLHTNYELDKQTNFYLQDLTGNKKSKFFDFLKDKNLYGDYPLKDNCFDVLNNLNEIYDIYIITSYIWNYNIDISGDNLKNKYYYLREKLSFILPEKYIFTTNKNIINADIMIDDKLDNLSSAKVKILFDAWHNRNIDDDKLKEMGVVRVCNWLEVLDLLGGKNNE